MSITASLSPTQTPAQTLAVGPLAGAVAAGCMPNSVHDYVSPRRVPAGAVNRGQTLTVEVDIVSAFGGRVEHPDARTVLLLAPTADLEMLLHRILKEFGFEDWDHLSELRIRSNRRKVGRDSSLWGTSDTTYPLQDEEWTGQESCADLTVASLLGSGDVAYLWFDYGDDWFFSLRVVDTAAPLADAFPGSIQTLYVPRVVVDQYGDYPLRAN